MLSTGADNRKLTTNLLMTLGSIHSSEYRNTEVNGTVRVIGRWTAQDAWTLLGVEVRSVVALEQFSILRGQMTLADVIRISHIREVQVIEGSRPLNPNSSGAFRN